jgi:hypothetical protein
LERSRDVTVTDAPEAAPRLGRIRSATDDIDPAAGQALGEQIDQFPCHHGLPWPLGIRLVSLGVLGAPRPPQPEQDRQADGPSSTATVTGATGARNRSTINGASVNPS